LVILVLDEGRFGPARRLRRPLSSSIARFMPPSGVVSFACSRWRRSIALDEVHALFDDEKHRKNDVCAGGWWLVAGGWWLVAGGWWLVAGGWWLVIVT
jgi:hypothetical protein